MRAGPPPPPASGPHSAPGRDPATIVTGTVLLAIAAATWVFLLSSTMRSDPGMAMEGTPSPLVDLVAFVASWAVMMTAMMLPSALPMIALYGAMQRKATGAARGVPVALFTVTYLALWAATGAPVYLATLLVRGIGAEAVPYGVAAALLAAGAYQFSRLKHVCLRACRSPFGFLLGHWRAGRRGSVALGWAHATYCLGCCWALMIVLLAAGAMGLPWVLLIAAVVAAEKLLPGGEWTARATGAALVLLGAAVAVRPELAVLLQAAHAM